MCISKQNRLRLHVTEKEIQFSFPNIKKITQKNINLSFYKYLGLFSNSCTLDFETATRRSSFRTLSDFNLSFRHCCILLIRKVVVSPALEGLLGENPSQHTFWSRHGFTIPIAKFSTTAILLSELFQNVIYNAIKTTSKCWVSCYRFSDSMKSK